MLKFQLKLRHHFIPQEHSKLPMVLMHVWKGPHDSLLILHSSTSENVLKYSTLNKCRSSGLYIQTNHIAMYYEIT